MKRISIGILVGACLASASLVPIHASADNLSDLSESSSLSSGFQECLSSTTEDNKADQTELGDNLGKGISEKVSPQLLRKINDGLSSAGRDKLPENTVALRYLDSGKTVGVSSDGKITASLDDGKRDVAVRTPGDPNAGNSVHDEIKRAVGACLGIGTQGATTWAALGEGVLAELASWETAVKFAVRRIGVVAAVSCLGGIVWEYI